MHSLSELRENFKDRNIQSSSNLCFKIDNIESKIAPIDETLLKISSQLEASNNEILDKLTCQLSSTKSSSQIVTNTRDIKELATLLDRLNGEVCCIQDQALTNKKDMEYISKYLSKFKNKSDMLAELSEISQDHGKKLESELWTSP